MSLLTINILLLLIANNLGRLMSPPPPNHRYSPNNFVDDRGRYGNRYSPDDSRYDDYPAGTDLYETETDFSPPRSPEPYNRRDRNHFRNYSPSPPPQPTNKKKYSVSKGDKSSSIDSSRSSSDDFDRRTF